MSGVGAMASARSIDARALVAGLSALSGGVALGVEEGTVLAAHLPWIGLGIAAIAIHLRKLGAQLYARAAFWSNLGLGVALCLLGGQSERGVGLWLALGCATALLLSGQRSLDAASESAGYRPTAARGGLVMLMVLTLADLQSFALFGLLEAEGGWTSGAVLLFALAGLYGLCFLGLLQLRAVSVWLCLLTSVAALLAIGGHLVEGIDRQTRQFCTVLVTGELVASGLVLLTLRHPLPAALRSATLTRFASAAAVVTLAGVGLTAYLAKLGG
jgi:hypothetical protein